MNEAESRALFGGREEFPKERVRFARIFPWFCAITGVFATLGVAWYALDLREQLKRSVAESSADATAIATLEATQRGLEMQLADARSALADARVLEQAAALRAKQDVERAGEASSLLRGVIRVWGAGTATVSPPALHELLRGEVLDRLQATLSKEAFFDLRLAAVCSMSRETSAFGRGVRDGDRVRSDFAFAKAFLEDAPTAVGEMDERFGEALLAVGEYCLTAQSIALLDAPAREVLRENARACAKRAGPMFATFANGALGRARALAIEGGLASIDRDHAQAEKYFQEARDILPRGASPALHAVLALRAAQSLAALDRRSDAIALLVTAGAQLEEREPFGVPIEVELRGMIVALLLEAGEQDRAMEARIALGRALVQARRLGAATETLSEAARAFAADETRFRERVEACIWLARALEARGMHEEAFRLLDQQRLHDDARILGENTVLARDRAALLAELRARSKPAA